jgi:hypothetical protein
MTLRQQIKAHLVESRMPYLKHLAHSIKQSNRLIVIAIKSYIHGVAPWLFANSGPLGVYKIYKEIKQMHHVQKMFKRHDDLK